MSRPLSFAALIQGFFEQHLAGERGLSKNTILSYRDTLRLLINFTAKALRHSADQLRLEDFDVERIRGFLDFLESERGSSPRTRNQRLAAIKSFFRYVASRLPEHLDRSRLIRDIANKRVEHKSPSYLDREDLESLFASIDSSTPGAIRDLALLTLMVNSGARVQEVVDLNVEHLSLSPTPMVHLRGKGGKERICPLWPQTARLLARWLESRQAAGRDPTSPLFTNSRGHRLTRWGVAHILKKRVRAAKIAPANAPAERISPHTLRHTTAMELLRANVDITVISAWLGHAHLSTTHTYVEIDLRMKQAALESTLADFVPPSTPAKYPKRSLVAWLDSLGRGPDYVDRRASLPRSSRSPSPPSPPVVVGST